MRGPALVVTTGGLLGWVLLSGASTGWPSGTGYLVAGVLTASAGYWWGRRARRPARAAFGVALFCGALVLGEDLLGCCPGPLDYVNAAAAAAVVGAGAACLSALEQRRARRWAAFALAVVLALSTPWRLDALAAAVGGVVVLACGLVALIRPPRRGRAVVVGAAVAGLLLVGATAVLAVAPRDAPLRDVAVASLSERRQALWADAVRLAAEHPLLGVGPGRFATESPTALADADTPQTHSVVLEAAAETGVPGALGVIAVGLLVLVPLARVGGARALVAAATWLALVLMTAVDYVADFPAVVGSAAAVLGLARGVSGSRAGRA
ncbi:MAG: O-antigen ligase family protein [Actinomycetes bacterium]